MKGGQKGNVKAGDGGAKFRTEWPELDKENSAWMKEHKIDPATGHPVPEAGTSACGPAVGLRRPSGSQAVVGAVVEGGRAAGDAGQGWIRRNKLLVAGVVVFTYVLIARILGEGSSSSA